jgi:hypothetical protein
MGRAGFTGADYSSLLGGLYEAEQKRLAAKAAQEAASVGYASNDGRFGGAQEPKGYGGTTSAKTSAEQSAEDQDMANMWQNSLISDDEWLAYVAGRVADTQGDAKANLSWVKLLRHDTIQVNDNRAYDIYKNQGGSAKDYLAYQESVIKQIDPDTQGYRDRMETIDGLRDQVKTQDIGTRVDQILKDIKNNKADYYDLRKYLSSAVKTLKTGQYKDLVQKELDQVNSDILSNETSGQKAQYKYLFDTGKISARAYGLKLKQIAEKYYKGDQATYYGLLDEAAPYIAAGNVKAGSGGGSGGGGGGGGGGGSTKPLTPTQSINKQIDAVDGVREELESAIQTAIDHPNLSYVMVAGKQVSRSTLINLSTRDVLGAYEAKAFLQTAKGDYSAAGITRGKAGDYITNVIQPANAIPAVEIARTAVANAQARILSAASDPFSTDTSSPSRIATEEGERLLRLVSVLETSYTAGREARARGISVIAPVRADGLEDQLPDGLLDDVKVVGNAFLDPNLVAEGTTIPSLAQDGSKSGSVVDKAGLTVTLGAVAEIRRVERGIADGTTTLVAHPTKGYVPVDYEMKSYGGEYFPTGNLDPKSVAQLELADDQGLLPYKLKINGQDATGWAVGSPAKDDLHKAWVASGDITMTDPADPKKSKTFQAGDLIPNAYIDANPQAWGGYQADGLVELGDAPTTVMEIIIPEQRENGRTVPAQIYYFDKKTRQTAYGGTVDHPLPGIIDYVDVNGDGTIDVDANGNASMYLNTGAQYVPMASTGYTPTELVASLRASGFTDTISMYEPDGTLLSKPIIAIGQDGKPLVNANGPVRDKGIVDRYEIGPSTNMGFDIGMAGVFRAADEMNMTSALAKGKPKAPATTGYDLLLGDTATAGVQNTTAPGRAGGGFDVSNKVADTIAAQAEALGIVANSKAKVNAAQSNRNLARVMSGGAAPVAIPTLLSAPTDTYSGPSGKDRALVKATLPKITAPKPIAPSKPKATNMTTAIAKGIKAPKTPTTKKPATKAPTTKKVVNKAVAS